MHFGEALKVKVSKAMVFINPLNVCSVSRMLWQGPVMLGLLVGVIGCVHQSESAAQACDPSFELVRNVSAAANTFPTGNKERGEQLFTSLCSGCHVHARLSSFSQAVREASTGQDTPVPPHLACERFQQDYSKEYLTATIKHGGRPEFKAHSMPAWSGILNDEDIADLVAYIVAIGDLSPDQE